MTTNAKLVRAHKYGKDKYCDYGPQRGVKTVCSLCQ